MRDAISQVRGLLAAKQGSRQTFLVPEFLAKPDSTRTRMVDVGDPYTFFVKKIDEILDRSAPPGARGIGTRDVVYQGFMRSFGSLDARIGTALTQLAFLTFLRDQLGVTVFLTLPTGVIGETNRKGRRGSPFAVRNPFAVDPSFADPLLPEAPALVQYRALCEAGGALGLRMGSVVPMATLAIDSPLFQVFPELGFWWNAAPGEFVFCAGPVEAPVTPYGSEPLSISPQAQGRFVPAPDFSEVRQVPTAAGPHFVADDARVTLANAFPDVLGGGAGTYTWQDVATVNYTTSPVPAPTGAAVRDYAPQLFSWTLMPAIIAWRYCEFGEQVHLIDVSPSVPLQVLTRARRLAASWQDGFSERLARLGAGELGRADAEALVRDLREVSEQPGSPLAEDLTLVGEELWQFDSPGPEVDCVAGPLIFCVSAHTRNREVFYRSLRHHLQSLAERQSGNPFLAGAANHDTMPASPGDVALLSVLYCFLPGAVTFIFSGTEWGAQQVTNKEFGFDTSSELLQLRDQLDETRLGLFNDHPVEWDGLCQPDHAGLALAQLLAHLNELRRAVEPPSGWAYQPLRLPDGLFGYLRMPARLDRGGLLITVVNFSDTPVALDWEYPEAELVHVGTDPLSWSGGQAHPGSKIVLSPASGLVGLPGAW